MKCLFVVGTDTGVGKTHVVCWATRYLREQGYKVGVCKPAVTGAEMRDGQWCWGDLDQLRDACGLDVPSEWICPNRWLPPLAPVAASRWPTHEGQTIQPAPMVSIEQYAQIIDVWTGTCDILLIEGIGGLLCPLTERETVAELAARWGFPVLIVSRLGLGTLNHTLMTYEVATQRKLPVAGVLVNQSEPGPLGPAEQTNVDVLRARLPVPVWGPIYQHPVDSIPELMGTIPWATIVAQRSPKG